VTCAKVSDRSSEQRWTEVPVWSLCQIAVVRARIRVALAPTLLLGCARLAFQIQLALKVWDLVNIKMIAAEPHQDQRSQEDRNLIIKADMNLFALNLSKRPAAGVGRVENRQP
jgi:hypothetical protein